MIQFSHYYHFFIFHKFLAIVIAQIYSNASIGCRIIKASRRDNQKHIALARPYLFLVDFGIQIKWVQC